MTFAHWARWPRPQTATALLYEAGNQWYALGSSEPVTALPRGASNLRWSPDGKRLAFVRADAVWVLNWETKRVTRVSAYGQSNAYLAHAGNRLAWSPDGQWLAFAGTLEPPPPPQDPIVITRILYKSRTALSDNRRTHVYVVPADGGIARLLTPPDRDQHSIDWSAGSEIVYLSNPEKDPDALLNYDIHAVNPSTGAIRQITKTPGVEMSPRISPDGQRITFTATTRRITTIDSVAEDAHVWVAPLAGGAAQEVNPKLDRRCMAAQWDGNSVLYLAQDQGKIVLYKDQERIIDRAASVGNVVRHQGKLYFAFSDAQRPRELWTQDGPVTQIGDPAKWMLSKPVEIRYRSFDGVEIEGWLFPPIGVEGQWPLILNIHGGPHGMFGYAFNPRCAGIRGARLCHPADQSARLHRIRPEILRRMREQLGRRRLQRPDGGSGLRPEEIPAGGSAAIGRHGRQLRRLHDELGGYADGPIQSGGLYRERFQSDQLLRHHPVSGSDSRRVRWFPVGRGITKSFGNGRR